MRMLLIARWYCWRRNMPCIWKLERMPWKHYSLRKENGVDNAKLLLIGEFMDAYGYEKTFENEKFVIFE